MLLGELLHRSVITTELQSTDRFAAIRELVDLLVAGGDLPEDLRDHAIDIVTARENSMSTGMEEGVALPHGSSEQIPLAMGALGISKQGVDFDCLDCQPARIVVLLLGPRDEFHTHVRTLAGVSHLLNDAEFRDKIQSATKPEDVLRVVRTEERSSFFARLKQKFTP